MEGNYSTPVALPKTTFHILLIEDDDDDAFILRELLGEAERFSFILTHANCLQQGAKLLAAKNKYDLVLLDLFLPDGKGAETVQCIQEISPDIPIIVLTGLSDEQLALQFVQNGVQDYLTKGNFDHNGLARSIRYAIERQRMRQQLEKAREIEHYLAYHDVLTGLPNRTLFYDRLEHALAKAKRDKAILGVMFIDLDGFKRINDTLGHGAGDALLKSVAQRLKQCLRESDTLARLGGDEFTIILENIIQETDTIGIAKKIIKTLKKSFPINGREVYVTASIGISLYPFDGSAVEVLVKRADAAMYRAKERGKNAFEFYNISIDSHSLEYFELEHALYKALEREEFVLYYQPLLDLPEKKITSAEALIRWHHPELGLIHPDKFIPIAEETGLIKPLGEWIIETACKHNKALQVAGVGPLQMGVNLSPRQFRQQNLHQKIVQALEDNQLAPACLMIEITENSAMKDVEFTISTLKTFKKLGVKIAIDDFGTGYSSLSYLKRLPADMLKIDRSFIDGLPADAYDVTLTAAIIGLASKMGLRVVAEGVETQEQLEYLESQNCNKIQGYHISKPLTFSELRNILIESNLKCL